jgi:hypothetical protein
VVLEEETYMRERNILKKAVVLLFAALMIFSSVAVLANTNTTPTAAPSNPSSSRDLVWDNVLGVHGALGGIIVAVVRPDGIAFPADDFMLTASKQVTSIAWQGGYFQCQLAQGQHDYNWDWRVIFWSDDGAGTHPANEIYNQTISTANIQRAFWYNFTRTDTGNTYWVANYSAPLPVPITLNGNTKYWVTIQGVGVYPPQACWVRHNSTVGGILLHQAVFLGALWGYTTWTDIQVLAPDGLPHDLNFQLFGTTVQDTTPPVTTCTLAGTMQGSHYITDVTATLTATDDNSGVNFTKYKIDDAATWTTYTVPFVVTGNGAHTIHFYSVDKAGNQETEKTSTFTIQYPIIITIKGGLGITATIKNNGTAPVTNLSWTINLSGGIILVGKTKTGAITTLAVGETATVKDFVVGFGKVTITVTTGTVQATATGTVILFFVIGVK